MVKKAVTGLHHITALTSDPQKNCDFYAGVLGLRLVKKTVNYDATGVYHLYYGDERGTPGTLMTFFPWVGMPKGKKGKGQLTVTSFSVSANALDYWMKRLDKFRVTRKAPESRFEDELFIHFEDPDGLWAELVFNKKDERIGFTAGNIPPEYAIRGLYGITLCVEGYEKTAGLLTAQMDHEFFAQKGNRFRYSGNGRPGDFVDVLCTPELFPGEGGVGTVHHVAFATENQDTQLWQQERLRQVGMNVTPVIDRQYFTSIYFREPGGVLFEIATMGPGFTHDEPLKHLGETLKLPPWEEKNRKLLESKLPPIRFNPRRFAD